MPMTDYTAQQIAERLRKQVYLMQRGAPYSPATVYATMVTAAEKLDDVESWVDDGALRAAHETHTLRQALGNLRDAIMDGLCNGGTPAYDKEAPARLDAAISVADALLK